MSYKTSSKRGSVRRVPAQCLWRGCDPENWEKLERVTRWSGLRTKWAGRKVRIYSAEHQTYWRPKAEGYTLDKAEAGVWPFEEALELTRHCGPEKLIQFGWVEQNL